MRRRKNEWIENVLALFAVKCASIVCLVLVERKRRKPGKRRVLGLEVRRSEGRKTRKNESLTKK